MMSILDTVLNTQDFQMLGTAVQIVHLEKILHGTEPFTLFAPRNLAFRQLTKVTFKLLLENTLLLTQILKAHIVPGKLAYRDLLKMCNEGNREVLITAIDGSLLNINLSDGIRIGNSTVVSTDIVANNGIIHSIDQLLLDSTVFGNLQHNIYAYA
jgi:uncharacterized surface protein with fasciclin (FAS1) repeats